MGAAAPSAAQIGRFSLIGELVFVLNAFTPWITKLRGNAGPEIEVHGRYGPLPLVDFAVRRNCYVRPRVPDCGSGPRGWTPPKGRK